MVNLTSEYEQEIPKQDYHYNRLQRCVRETISTVRIISIQQVHNKYLSLAFTIKEKEMQNKTHTKIEEYIHATGATKVASILKQNLNWRLVRRSKYGQGVSFSKSASYANRYCNNNNGTYRAFIFCDVLVGNTKYVYDNSDTHPPKNIDSYQSNTGFVLVKFDDFTYNPKFVVYYQDGVYERNSPLDNVIYGWQQGSGDSLMRMNKMSTNREQLTLLIQILQIPHENKDFINAMRQLALSDKRRQESVPPKLTPQGPSILPLSPQIVDKSRSILPQRTLPQETTTAAIQHQIVLTRDEIEAGLTNLHSLPYRPSQPTTSPNQTCRKICGFLVFILMIILFGGIINYLF